MYLSIHIAFSTPYIMIYNLSAHHNIHYFQAAVYTSCYTGADDTVGLEGTDQFYSTGSSVHFTYSEGKQAVKTEKLHASEKVKYEIYRAVKEALRSASTWKEFQNKLLKMGVEMEFKYKGNTNEVQGICFIKDNQSFKGSEIDRSFSWSRLDAALDHNHVTSLENDVSQKQPYHEQSHGTVIDNLVEVIGTGGVFMPSVAPTEDEKEAERLRKKKKRRKRRSL